MTCDVELHLRAEDWAAHGHARDPGYDAVELHVVLFPPEKGHVTRGAGGREIPVLVLLPLLHHDLEEFAADDAVERLAGRQEEKMPAALAGLGARELRETLREHAETRWRQKVHFARLRMQRLGWQAACHSTALEILGYRFNRAPMLRVAARWSLAEWGRGAVDADEAFAVEAGAWSLQGVRPANHPRTRLRQYAKWAFVRPDWAERLAALAINLPRGSKIDPATTAGVRREGRFVAWRKAVAEICGEAVGGSRLDNLMCDGFLPLMAASGGEEGALREIWFHWWPGDLPPKVARGLRELEVVSRPAHPACHGAAQGLLSWLLEDSAKRLRVGRARGLTRFRPAG